MNILMFVPIGLTMPNAICGLNKHCVRSTITICCLFSLCIELCQYVFGLGRCEIDDIIMNTIGAVLGITSFLLYRWIKSRIGILMEIDMNKLSGNLFYGLYTCRLISSVINDTEPPALPENMSLDSLYAYQLTQDVISIAYAALERLDPSLNLQEYSMDNKRCILREARFDIAGQELYGSLEKAAIPFLPLKGAILKDLYPKPYHRYFTDFDIYVGDEFDRAEKVLLELGYEKLVDTDHNDVSYVKKPSLHIELHKDLFPDDYTFKGYFDSPYEHTKIKEGYKYYHLYYDDDFFIHVLCHLYKHFTFGGCGLKQFLDIYVMTKELPLNMEYIHTELRSIGLDGFLNTVLRLNAFFFDGDKPDNDLIEIAEYVFNAGTFGNEDNRMALDYVKENGEKPVTLWGQIKFFVERWQLKFPNMKRQYTILDKAPVLLPFCYIHKAFRAVFFRRTVVKQQIDDMNKLNSGFSEHIDYINHILEISGAKAEIIKESKKNG